jgi:tRNA threonylcarbamoyladenosine modification (KEOPS) complex Cgi121 subunit
MQKRLEEYGKTVEITGFRNIHIKDGKTLSQTLARVLPRNCEVQFFDAALVATWEHLYFAVLNAIMNLKGPRGISMSVAVETVLYASAQRQIQKAIDFIGLKPDSKNAAVVVICENAESAKAGLEAASKLVGAEPDESVLELSKVKITRIKRAFDITNAELCSAMARGVSDEQAIVDLVVERVALLSTRL